MRSTAYRRLWAHALLGAALAAMTVQAQDGKPVVVTRPTAADAGTLLPGVMNKMTVVLDAAHGGADTGARISAPGGSTLLEKDVTLALALRLQAALQARGFTVVMTRVGDAANKPATAGAAPVPMSSDDRAGIANSARASACLLLHAAGSGHGVHLYTSELDGVSAEAPVLPWQTAQTAWVSLSAQLSRQLGQALQETGVPRISGRASVRPVDSLTCPAVIVELAPEGEDVSSVNDPSYQQRVAIGIAGALEAWAKQVQPPPRLPNTLGRPKTAEPNAGGHATTASGEHP
ncbi:N-acetylmuramoyl-L-alanine amidase [Granulicella sp. 5B5]|uniref:N-acetylmuramoyl-L-alanine amidase family protein n=1 Tax=Granulicella sp. 5B5 TaxID=1617967 RepID=UPI0015F4A130|nr:N-acetylmuramoyl-L-alanine amidase [Granulicella sp. 5B5]